MMLENPESPNDFKFHDLRCFDAVVRHGSFQAAARAVHRSHPSVFAAVSRLESRLGLALLDRSGYRVTLTPVGVLFHARARLLLAEAENLQIYAGHLASEEETSLHIVLGDLCDRPKLLRHLSEFFAGRTRTRLNLDYEAVGGPAERLLEGTADLVFHRGDHHDRNFEQLALYEVDLIPVATADFLPFAASETIEPEAMRPYVQCIIRDTARREPKQDHFLIEGAPNCSVPDHAMKKEIILHGMAWGHLPAFMVEEELRTGHLISLRGRHLPGRLEMLSAMRRRDRPHGPVANALWRSLQSAWRPSAIGG